MSERIVLKKCTIVAEARTITCGFIRIEIGKITSIGSMDEYVRSMMTKR
ncbi:MAG: hypothetical protein LRY71_13005 [Bacillaceae bacterium]|nr:hypothetical protein [Bacillaceae bacterium]